MLLTSEPPSQPEVYFETKKKKVTSPSFYLKKIRLIMIIKILQEFTCLNTVVHIENENKISLTHKVESSTPYLE